MSVYCPDGYTTHEQCGQFVRGRRTHPQKISMKNIKRSSVSAAACLSLITYAWAQESAHTHMSPADLPTDSLLSEPGPTFKIPDFALPSPVTVIAFGDQRFTDPTNVRVTNPRVRKWLVDRIAEEKPGAGLLNGGVPYSGDG